MVYHRAGGTVHFHPIPGCQKTCPLRAIQWIRLNQHGLSSGRGDSTFSPIPECQKTSLAARHPVVPAEPAWFIIGPGSPGASDVLFTFSGSPSAIVLCAGGMRAPAGCQAAHCPAVTLRLHKPGDYRYNPHIIPRIQIQTPIWQNSAYRNRCSKPD